MAGCEATQEILRRRLCFMGTEVSGGVSSDPASAEAAGRVIGKAKATGTATPADMAVAAAAAVVGTEGSASEEEVTLVVMRVEKVKLVVGVVAGEANGVATVQVATAEVEAGGPAVAFGAEAEAAGAAVVLGASYRRLAAG